MKGDFILGVLCPIDVIRIINLKDKFNLSKT